MQIRSRDLIIYSKWLPTPWEKIVFLKFCLFYLILIVNYCKIDAENQFHGHPSSSIRRNFSKISIFMNLVGFWLKMAFLKMKQPIKFSYLLSLFLLFCFNMAVYKFNKVYIFWMLISFSLFLIMKIMQMRLIGVMWPHYICKI